MGIGKWEPVQVDACTMYLNKEIGCLCSWQPREAVGMSLPIGILSAVGKLRIATKLKSLAQTVDVPTEDLNALLAAGGDIDPDALLHIYGEVTEGVRVKIQERERLAAEERALQEVEREAEKAARATERAVQAHENPKAWGGSRVNLRTLAGKVTTVSIDLTSMVGELKIAYETEKKVCRDLQMLIFNGKILEDDKPLSAYGLKNNSTIQCVVGANNSTIHNAKLHLSSTKSKAHAEGFGSDRVYIRTLTGKTVAVFVNLDHNVQELKAAIQDVEGTPPAQQRLLFAGKELNDGRSIRSNGVDRDSTVHLVWKLRGGMFHCTTDSAHEGEAHRQVAVQSVFFGNDAENVTPLRINVGISGPTTFREVLEAVAMHCVENKKVLPMGLSLCEDRQPPPESLDEHISGSRCLILYVAE